MSIVADYIAENTDHLDERLRANVGQIADDHWPAVLEALAIINPGSADPGIDCDVIITTETIADFDRSRAQHWSEQGQRRELLVGGSNGVHYDRFQRHKGARRDSCIIIDIGAKRVVLR
jgi:hypothetical protein